MRRPPAPLLPVAMSLIAGIVAACHFPTSEHTSLALLAAGVLVAALLYRLPRLQTAAIIVCTALLGLHLAGLEIRRLRLHHLPPRSYELRMATANDEGTGVLHRARQRMLRQRDLLAARYQEQGLADDAYSLVVAMTLGDKATLSSDLRETYAATGASHVLALSGLHLGIIYWLVTLLMVGRRRRMVSQVVTILAIWAFAFLTGLSPSIVRSATMLTVYGLLSVGYRRGASVNVLAFTAVVMLVVSPLAVFDISFQMSFLAVLAILLFHPLLFRLLPSPWLQAHPVAKWLWGMLTLSLSAQLGVAPLIAFYFHRFSTYFLLSNFIVIPGAYLILLGGLLLLLTGLPLVASLLAGVASLMNGLLSALSSLPLSTIDGLRLSVLQIVLLYVVVGCAYVVITVFSPHR